MSRQSICVGSGDLEWPSKKGRYGLIFLQADLLNQDRTVWSRATKYMAIRRAPKYVGLVPYTSHTVPAPMLRLLESVVRNSLSRVSMLCIQSAILFSVRPSVCPIPTLCLNEWTCRRTFWHSDRDLILVFFRPPLLLQNSKGTLSRGFKYNGWEILQMSPFISEKVRDRAIVSMEH